VTQLKAFDVKETDPELDYVLRYLVLRSLAASQGKTVPRPRRFLLLAPIRPFCRRFPWSGL